MPTATNFAGVPCRDWKKPWPKYRSKDLLFVGQINFSQSTDLIPVSLPGDLLLIYVKDLDCSNDEMFAEWVNCENSSTARDYDYSKNLFHRPHYGTVLRTHEFVDIRTAIDTDTMSGLWRDASINGTKVGGNEMGIPNDNNPDYYFLGHLGPVIEYKKDETYKMYFGDLNGLSIYYNPKDRDTVII
jgi:hypothetical protein